MPAQKLFLVAGALFAFAGVALGAFAAHLLKDRLTADLFQIFEVAVRYHIYHALALLAVAVIGMQWPAIRTEPAGWLFVGGIFLFSGSLYLMSLTGQRWLGAVTPVGGLCFLAGWLWLGWSAWKSV